LILDEMNLSHVERYFADVLSAIESGEAITLYTGDPRAGVPSRVTLPSNLVIVGTVNVDETTYMFSPKVLDRANVIEFRVRADRMRDLIDGGKPVDLPSIQGRGQAYGSQLVAAMSARHTLAPRYRDQLKAELGLFYRVLEHFGLEFGYRVAGEAAEFIAVHRELTGRGWSFDLAFDAQIVQKLLPKLNGSQRAIEPAIRALATLCLAEPSAESAREGAALEIASSKTTLGPEAPARYPMSRTKLLRMARTVSQNGFVSFAEA
jgi:5-methylcytosine-specific restriction protein B